MERIKNKNSSRQINVCQTDIPQTVQTILSIFRDEHGEPPPRLVAIFFDVANLYRGRWPSHEACGVPYHNFCHALDICLASARMLSGWNKTEARTGERTMEAQHFMLAMAAGLFHDAGYIKEKGDNAGHGGKFTLVHVKRSMDIAREYLTGRQWSQEEIEAVCGTISCTDYAKMPNIDALFTDEQMKNMARIVPTADLVAQMADTEYAQRLDDLFAEFKEVYEYENYESLDQAGATVYKSAQEMKDNAFVFFEQFVFPTLVKLGRMDRYLSAYFGDAPNIYQENIAANLYGYFKDGQLSDSLYDFLLDSEKPPADAMTKKNSALPR